jgi:hypothetical protein
MFTALDEKSRFTWIAGALIIALVMGMLALKVRITPWGSANTKSRFAMIQCLVEEQTFAIDCSPYKATMDRVKLDEKLYSSKPPLLAFAAASVYFVLHAFGLTLKDDENLVVATTNVFFALIPHFVLLVFFLRFLVLLRLRPHAVVFGMFAIGPSFLGTGYATDLNNHSPAATLVVIALFYAWRAWTEQHDSGTARTGDFVKSGLAAGVLPAIDLPSGAVSAGVLVLLFVVDKRRALFAFLPATLPGVVAHFALTYGSTGSIIPVYMRKELYEYPTTPPKRDPKIAYVFHMLFGHHGIFSMTPVLAIGALAVARELRRRAEHHALALFTAVVALVLFVFYIVETHNYGGTCVGFRWAIASMPILVLFFARFVDDDMPRWFDGSLRGRLRAVVVVAMLAFGFIHVQNAMDNPWQDSWWQKKVFMWGAPPAKKPRAKAAEKVRERAGPIPTPLPNPAPMPTTTPAVEPVAP